LSPRKEIIGGCELYLGDCREILPTLAGIDAVVTDPPYGIADAAFSMGKRSGKRSGGDNVWHADSHWDKEIDPEWCRLTEAAAPIVIWFGQWRKREEIAEAFTHPLRAEIVWAKDCHAGPPSPLAPRDERIWVFASSGITGSTFETSVWDHPVIPTWSHKHHKNEKPVGLMRRLIAWVGVPTIADPFMGSGTTGIACMNLGRRFVGIEREAEHFDTACRRIEAAAKQPDLFIEQPAPKPQQLSLMEPAE
jgi:site-specific DNA-methyltransferase (adenine-specific)